MKNSYKHFVLFLSMVLLLGSEISAQSFYTGAIGVTRSNGGRTRIFSDNLTTRQIDRISLLVGANQKSVYDYNEDQDVVVNAATVASPALSDFEVTSTLNNSYSNLPPNIESHLNIYGWTNGAYLVVKENIKNNEASAIDAVIGLEVLSQVDGTYELDTLKWNAGSQSVLINQSKWVGFKLFSGVQKSLRLIDWTSGYGNDSLYTLWLNQGTFDPKLISTAEGTVAVFGQNSVSINAGASVDFYYGISLGTDEASCLANMSLCENRYHSSLPVEFTSFTAVSNGNYITLNWTTATELNNQGFEIQRNTNGTWTTVGFKDGAKTTTNTQNYSFVDELAAQKSGKISYRLKQIDFNGTFKYSAEISVDYNKIPTSFTLDQNYPNPFNPSTKISFSLSQKGNVALKIFNTLGEQVAEVVNENLEAGNHSYNFNASSLPSGLYIYSLQTDEKTISKKMTLLK